MFKKFNLGNLFWKLDLPIIVLFTVVILALSFYIPTEITNRTIAFSTVNSKQMTKKFKVLRKYYIQNIITKITASSKMKLAIVHKNNPSVFPLPATMIHDLRTLLKKRSYLFL